MSGERSKAAAGSVIAGIASVDEHGDEPMTSAQADELRALCETEGLPFDKTLSRDAAAAKIAELKGEDGLSPPQS